MGGRGVGLRWMLVDGKGGRGGSVVGSVPCVRKVTGSNPTLVECGLSAFYGGSCLM